MSDLNTAIQFVRQGEAAQAQKILETIVRTESSNIPAWLWYAQTFPSQEMRLKVLVACLKFNPGNEQVLQAVRLMRGKTSAQSTPPIELPPGPAFNSVPDSQEDETFPVSPSMAAENSVGPRPAFIQAQPTISKPAFDWDELEQTSAPAAPVFAAQTFLESLPPVSETKAPPRSYKFYEVWWMALTIQDVRAYVDLLDDPEAGTSRAIEWQVYTNLVFLSLSAMLGFFQLQTILGTPQFKKLSASAPIFNSFSSGLGLLIFLVVFVLVGVLVGVLGLLLNGAIQNFLAHLFGGTGNFSRTVYALGAYLIPISIIVTTMSYIPLINCLTIFISGYAFVLNVRALQAAHGLNGGRATIIVAIPTLILLMVMCGSFVFLSTWIRDILPNYKYPSVP
jgi:hypothetical protein